MTRPSIPPAPVTTCSVTWAEISSDARATTTRATSSACSTFFSAIARGPERRRQVRPQRCLPARERQLPDRHVLLRPDTRDGGAHIECPCYLEQPVRLSLDSEIRSDDRRRPERLRPLSSTVVMGDHVAA